MIARKSCLLALPLIGVLALACGSESGTSSTDSLGGSANGAGASGAMFGDSATTGGAAGTVSGEPGTGTGGMGTGGMGTSGAGTGGVGTGGMGTSGAGTGGAGTGDAGTGGTGTSGAGAGGAGTGGSGTGGMGTGGVSTGGAGTGGEATAGSGPVPCGLPSLTAMTIYMIGDSTMATKPIPNDENERGWGQILEQFFDESKVTVSNHARNGRSSKSFIDEGLWDEVESQMATDDWLIIQFGHNDAKGGDRHTDPFTTYAANLRMFAQTALDNGVHPIICTSIVRGGDPESHGDYPEAAIALAAEMGIPLVDLETYTKEYVFALDDKKAFYIDRDGSHTREAGATKVCEFFVEDIQEQSLPLSCYSVPYRRD